MDNSFIVRGAQVWNELPDQIQRAGCVSEFKSLVRARLKMAV